MVPEKLAWKAWDLVCNAKHEDLHNNYSNSTSSSAQILEYSLQQIVNLILQASNNECVESYLTADNVYNYDEFSDEHFFC